MPENGRFLLRVMTKGLVLFVILNILFAAADPLPALGRLSLYNHIVPGRVRLPFGSAPSLSYNLSLNNLEAMLASHEIASAKPPDEYRVVILGDSSVWGFLLKPEETRAAQLNSLRMESGGKRVRFYNLGYPTISLMKDLLILRQAAEFQPDLIVWPVTLEAFPQDKQTSSPLVQNNPQAARELISTCGLRIDPGDPAFVNRSFWDRTVIGRRRDLADLIRLQVYGFSWAATGVDVYVPESYEPPVSNLPDDPTFHTLTPPRLERDDLAWDVLAAGRILAGGAPILIVNEPIYISRGENSDIRYNVFYPRWAYDQYRLQLSAFAADRDFYYLDLWDRIPADQFTNSAIHLSPSGEQMVAQALAQRLQSILEDLPQGQ